MHLSSLEKSTYTGIPTMGRPNCGKNSLGLLGLLGLWEDVESDVIDNMEPISCSVRFESDQIITAIGQRPLGLYLLTSGLVQCFGLNDLGEKVLVSELQAGDVFGESVLTECQLQHLEVRTVSSTTALLIPSYFLFELYKNSALVSFVMQKIVKRIKETELRLHSLETFSPEIRHTLETTGIPHDSQ
jgi:CRP-like cAMP-binding protein